MSRRYPKPETDADHRAAEPSPVAQVDGPSLPCAEAACELAQAVQETNLTWVRLLARPFLECSSPPHSHESEYQLEVPRALEAVGEKDLFA